MATDLRNLPAFLADDATFRTWGSGIAAQLAAVGLVQASDTGQINWGTVTRPGAAQTFAGYEIWRFNDSLQASKPVFIKIEYGTGFTNLDRPGMRWTVCTATNGAGTPAGQVGVVRPIYANTSKSAGNTLPSYCSGSSSRLNLVTHLDAANSAFAMWLLVERTKTSAGANTGDGIVAWSAGSPNSLFQVVPYSGSIPTAGNRNMACSLTDAGVSLVGANAALSPTIAPLGQAYWASWCAYMHADLSELVAVPADHLGATRTFMPIGDGLPSAVQVQGTTTGHSLAILWE